MIKEVSGSVGLMRVLLTGLPGSGKSTVLLRVVEKLRSQGFRIGGIITPEVRSAGRRTAFKVVDLRSGREAILASSEMRAGPQVGRYRVDVRGFEEIALNALEHAQRECDLVCVDEIGRMELFSSKFRESLDALFKSEKPVVAVVHRDFVRVYGGLGTLLTVTPENRDVLVKEIVSMVVGPQARRSGE